MQRFSNENEITEPEFKTELEARAWHKARDKERRERAAAAAKYPAGMILHVSSARGITRRARAGIVFNGKATTAVEVVEGTDEEIAARVKASEAVVSSMGAKAIDEDDGLIVHGSPRTRGGPSADVIAEKDDEIAQLKARVRELTRSSSPATNDGRPTRLGGRGGAKSTESKDTGEDFGGDTNPDPKAPPKA